MPLFPRKLNHLLARVNFPLYTVQCLTERHILVAGGGGSSKTGIKNIIEIYELINNDGSCRAERVTHYDTGSGAIMNCALYNSGNFFVLFAGMEGNCHVFKLKYEYDPLIKSVDAKRETSLHSRKVASDSSSNVNDSHKYHASDDGNFKSSAPECSISFSVQPIDAFQTDVSNDPFQKLVKFNKQKKLLATAGADGHIRVWKYPQLNMLHEIHAHDDDVDDIDICASGDMMVSVSRDGKGKIWNCEGGSLISELQYTLPIKSEEKYIFRSCRFSPNDQGGSVLFTTINPKIRKKPPSRCYICKWDTETCCMKQIVSTGVDVLTVMAVSDNGHFIGLGTQEGSVKIYTAFHLQVVYKNDHVHGIFVTGLEFVRSSDQCRRIMGGHEASLISISVDNHINVHHIPVRASVGVLPLTVLFIFIMLIIFVTMDYFNL